MAGIRLSITGAGSNGAPGNGNGNGGGKPSPTPPATSRFSGVITLGDSLIDAGNALGLAEWYDGLPFQDLPEGAPTAELGYFEGRFTNCYTYADLVTNKYTGKPSQSIFPYGYEEPTFGIRIAPFEPEPKDNNLNWGYGGAQIRGGGPIPNLYDQTDAMRDAADGKYDPGALFLITMGGNDVRELAPATGAVTDAATAATRLQKAADALLGEIGEMVARGASHFVITGLPDVGLIPRYDTDFDGVLDPTPGSELDRARTATQYSQILDDLIREQVVPAARALGAEVTYVPLADVLDDQGNVIEQGALDRILPTLADLHGIALQDLQDNLLQYQDTVFFDRIHPTAQVHALVGSLIHATLEGMEWIEGRPLASDAIDLSFAGSIDTAGEVDTFTVSLRRGDTWTFEMLGMSTLGIDGSLADPLMEILDPRGKAISEFQPGSGEDSGLGFDALLTFTAGRSGDYAIRVSATGSLTGDYVIHGAMAEPVAGTSLRLFVNDSSLLTVG